MRVNLILGFCDSVREQILKKIWLIPKLSVTTINITVKLTHINFNSHKILNLNETEKLN